MLGFFLIIGACVLWAIDTLIRYPLMQGGVDSFAIVFYEHLILSIIFLVVFFKYLPKLNRTKPVHILLFLFIGGVGSALSTLTFTQAFNYLNPSLVILLQKFQPVVAISLAHFVLKERIKKEFILWAIVCLTGALIISYQDIYNLIQSDERLSEMLIRPGAILGLLLVFFSVFGWGASTVFGKKLVQLGYQDEQIMAGRFLTGFLCLIPFIPFHHDLFTHTVDVYGKVSLMVFVSGLLAMYLYYHGLRKVSARACSIAELFFPFMAVIVNWLVLDATLSFQQLLGGAVLLMGSLVIQIKHY